ncbi:hypothetical protein VB714_26615 [Spirulina sp. 06S082]|nr:hypothetical protein [Spirulina sp. 06S082]
MGILPVYYRAVQKFSLSLFTVTVYYIFSDYKLLRSRSRPRLKMRSRHRFEV